MVARSRASTFDDVSGNVSRANARLPFTDRLECTLPYAQTFSLSTPSGTSLAATSAYRMTGVYDPDQSGTGHQPFQYDQVQDLYGFYIVKACRYKITFNAAAVPGLWVGVNLFNSSNGNGSAYAKTTDVIIERNGTKLRPLPSTGGQVVVMSGVCHPWRLFGITREQWLQNTISYGSATNTTPLAQVFLEVIVVDPEGRTAQNVYVTAELEYDIEFYGYITPLQS